METIIVQGMPLDSFLQLVEERSYAATIKALASFHATNKEEEYISAKDVCKKLNISRPTLGKYAKKGIIKKHPLGGKIYFKTSEVEAAMNRISSPIKTTLKAA